MRDKKEKNVIAEAAGTWKMEEDSVAYVRKMRIEADIARTKKLGGWIAAVNVNK